jgi:serine phosphatase RsbU (regulator of sigma subunit)
MRLADPDALATALAAAYDPATRELIVASAGHPSPILVEGDLVDEVVARGPVLGLGDTADYVLGRRRLAPDARLVLYTDGITEANRDLDLGYARLIGAIRAVPRNHASPAAAIVQGALGDAGATDDVAVLVATITSTERS